MYESYYSFTAEPFRLTPDHRMCFRHPSYQKAKTYMEYALRRREGFIMITGKPGTGKTTLINDLLDNLPTENLVTARLDSIHLESEELLRMVAFSFGLEGEKLDKTTLLRNMTKFLNERSKEGKKGLLIVDEGQALSSSALEELRLLSNIQDAEGPLLQVFLVGQEGLLDVMRSPSMAQLHQRLIAACHLDPLAADQTEAYIKHRLRTVGWKGDPEIRDDMFPLIHKFSLGVPRRINLICSRLLLSGYVHEKHVLGIEDVQHSIEDLREEKLTFSDDELAEEPNNLSDEASQGLASNAAMESTESTRFSLKGLINSKLNRPQPLGSHVSVLQKQGKARVAAFFGLIAVASLTFILALYLSFQGTEQETNVLSGEGVKEEQVVASSQMGEVQDQPLREPVASELRGNEEPQVSQQLNELEQQKLDERQVTEKLGLVQKDQVVPAERQQNLAQSEEETAQEILEPQQVEEEAPEHERLVVLSMDQDRSLQGNLSKEKATLAPLNETKEEANLLPAGEAKEDINVLRTGETKEALEVPLASQSKQEISVPTVSEPNADAEQRVEQTASSDEQKNANRVEKNQEIQNLLTLATRQRRYFKMTIPDGDNAYETYTKVLELDPANREAKVGLADLVNFYRRRAVSYKEEGSYELSLEFIHRGLKVKPSNTELLALQEQVETRLSRRGNYR